VEKLTMALRIVLDGNLHEIDIVQRRPHLVVRIDGREHEVSKIGSSGDGRHTIEIAGTAVHFARATAGDRQFLRIDGRGFEARLFDPRSEEAGGGGQDSVKAPMPGAVIYLHKAVGDHVLRGEPLITIESMKLQTALPAPRDGVIAAILRAEGEVFDKDEVIVRLEAAAQES
jgi:3-methylcrotonyl-CoA carboxylase alpha subunit